MFNRTTDIFQIKSSCGDTMICDRDYFYVYKNKSYLGCNPGLYKFSGANDSAGMGPSARMVGNIVHSNTS
jgi:hypothetical protein